MSRTKWIIAIAIAAAAVAVWAQFERPPAAVLAEDCKVDVVGIDFVTKLECERVTMTERDTDKYRIAVVTLRIEKPAGASLELAASDLSLHYWRSNGDYDVAPCEALSTFSRHEDSERMLRASPLPGPGWTKIRTGTSTRRASVIYCDAVFAKVESDVERLWVFVGQPATAAYETEGW